MDNKRKTGALITAAGMSTRMGQLKQTLPIGGVTIIEMVVSHFLHAGVEEIAVVAGYRADDVRAALRDYPVTILENPDYAHTQMFDSVRIGLSFMKDRCDRLFFTPVDVPAFRESTLLEELRRDEQLIVPCMRGRRGHPILIDAALIPGILAFSGDGGLKGALDALVSRVCFLETEDEGAMIDADTPDDYHAVVELYNREHKKAEEQ